MAKFSPPGFSLETDEPNPFLEKDPEKKVKNIDLLFRSLNELLLALSLKLEQAEQANDEKMIAYIQGQIAGCKYANSIVDAFFDI